MDSKFSANRSQEPFWNAAAIYWVTNRGDFNLTDMSQSGKVKIMWRPVT